MELSRQEYWSGLPCPPPGDLPDPGMEPRSPALAGRFFTLAPPGKPMPVYIPPKWNQGLSPQNESRDSKRYLYTHIHHSTIQNSPKGKQPKCLSKDEWIFLKMWNIMEYYSAFYKEGTFTVIQHDETWRHMLNVISQTQKDRYCMIPLIRRIV